MQDRDKHKIKNHKLDFKDIRKKADKDNYTFKLMLIVISSLPCLFFLSLLYNALVQEYVYALIRFKGIRKIYLEQNPDAFILGCVFLFLYALALSGFPATQISELRVSKLKKQCTHSEES